MRGLQNRPSYGISAKDVTTGLLTSANPLASIGTSLYSIYNQVTGNDKPAAPPGAYAPVGYDPTQLPVPAAPENPEGSKLPAWVLPVGVTVGALLLFSGAAYLAVTLDKRKTSKSTASVVSKVKNNPKRRRSKRR